MGRSKNLNESQVLATQMVAGGMKGKEIATKLKKTEETISRWRQLPEFEAAVNKIKIDVMNSATDRLRELVNKAISMLEEGLDSDDLPIKDKVNASLKILDLCGMKQLITEEIGPIDPEIVEKKKNRDEFFNSIMY